MRALTADIGGTHARVELWEAAPASASAPAAATRIGHVTLHSADHASAEAAIDAALLQFEKRDPGAMVLAVAGPVADGRCRATNLPWVLDERALGERYRARVRLLNDFEAAAHGIGTLEPEDLAPLQPGDVDPLGTVALLGAGTGLGEALVLRESGGIVRVVPTEGGHADFGPWDERSDVVLRRLRERHGHVSVERVASGLGLGDLFEIVCSEGWAAPRAATLAALGADPGAAIGAAAPNDPAARLTVEIFSRALGAEAGNLALKSLPRGGVRIAGGIPPKLLATVPELFRREVLAGLLEKGRMRPILARLRVDVVLAPDLGLRGARKVALELLGSLSP